MCTDPEPCMPDEVISWLSTNNWGLHHGVWHASRTNGSRPVRLQNWLRDAHAPDLRKEGEPGSGLDFLAMHRVMVQRLQQALPTQFAQPLAAWTEVPRNPDSPAADAMPHNGIARPFDTNKAKALDLLRTSLTIFPDDDALGRFLESDVCPPAALPGVRLAIDFHSAQSCR